MLFLLLGLLKIPLAALLIWMPFRSDQAMLDDDEDGVDGEHPDGGDDGGGGQPHSPRPDPNPSSPPRHRRKRGAHGEPSSPRRVRFPFTAPRRRVLGR